MAIPSSLPAKSSTSHMQGINPCMNTKQILKITAIAIAVIAAIVSFVFLPWPIGLGFSLIGLVIIPWLFIDCPRIDSARFFQHDPTQNQFPFWRSLSRWTISDYNGPYHHQGRRIRVGDPYDIPTPHLGGRPITPPPQHTNIRHKKKSESSMSHRVGVGSGLPHPTSSSSQPPVANLAGRRVVPAPEKESAPQSAAKQSIPPHLPPGAGSTFKQRVTVGGDAGQAPPRLTPGVQTPSHSSSHAPQPIHHSSGSGSRTVVGGDAGKAPPRLTPKPGSKPAP